MYRYFSDISDTSKTRLNATTEDFPASPGISISEIDGVTSNASESTCPQISPATERPTKLNVRLTDSTRQASKFPIEERRSPSQIDNRLNEWLINHNIDSNSKAAILSQEFLYEDFIFEMERTDLQRIGLK